MRLWLRDMLADSVQLGGGGVCFPLGSGTEALYPINISVYAYEQWAVGYILTVVLNVLAELYVNEPFELGEQGEALGC